MRLGLGLGFGIVSGGPSATPLTIVSDATIVGWWRSDMGISIGTGVSAWENQQNIGGGTGWTQGTPANQPTYSASDSVFNGRPSLLWDGTDDEMQTTIAAPAPGTTNRFYWIIAQNLTFISGISTLISGVGGTAHIVFRANTDTSSQLTAYNAVARQGAANFPIGGAARLIQVGLTNSTADFFKIGGTNSTGINAGNNSAASMRLGSFGGAGRANVKVAEVLITNGIPSAGTRLQLESYATSLYPPTVIA